MSLRVKSGRSFCATVKTGTVKYRLNATEMNAIVTIMTDIFAFTVQSPRNIGACNDAGTDQKTLKPYS
jgi:hypothetical protein